MQINCLCQHQTPVPEIPEPEIVRTRLRHDVERNVLHCAVCDLVYLEHRPADLHDYYREQYRNEFAPAVGRQMSAQETFDMYRPFMDERVERVRPHLGKDMSVLEIGCSTGHFLDAIRQYVKNLRGIEYNEAHAKFVAEELGIPCSTAPIQESGLEERSIDLIFMFHVFEHVEDPVEFLEGMKPYLSQRGKVFIEVPNIQDALITPYSVSEYANFYYREPHLSYFSPQTLTDTLALAGFDGQIEMIQRYSLANHLHWITSNGPMPDARSGMKIPKFAESDDDFAVKANEWLAKTDAEYRDLLKQHQRAESMSVLARQI